MNLKEQNLRNQLQSYSSVIVAYSGGVDSSLIAKIATQELGNKAQMVISKSPSLGDLELSLAKNIALKHSFNLQIIETQEINSENYNKNPHNRCYFCKKELYHFLNTLSKNKLPILDGTNGDDLKELRHGRRAALEYKIISPLADQQFSKKEVRQLAKKLKLENWDKPQAACLASRFPTGIPITHQNLKSVERAETFIRSLGIKQLRVRYHNEIARIECLPEEISSLLQNKDLIENHLKEIGFKYITLDLAGYHSPTKK